MQSFQRTSLFGKILFLVKVEGMSVWPHLVPGKRYLASSLFEPHLGDFIVFSHPKFPDTHLVKRVTEEQPGGFYLVEGNLPWATSSRELGPIHVSAVQGRIFPNLWT